MRTRGVGGSALKVIDLWSYFPLVERAITAAIALRLVAVSPGVSA